LNPYGVAVYVLPTTVPNQETGDTDMKTCTSLTLAAATFALFAVAAPSAFGQEVKSEVEKEKQEYAAQAADKAAMKCKEMAVGDEEAAKKCEHMHQMQAEQAMKGCRCGEDGTEKCEEMHAERMAMAEENLAKATEKCEAKAAEGDAEGAEACEAKVAEQRATLAEYGEQGMQCEMRMHEHEMKAEKAERYEKEMKEEAAEGKDEGDEG
jgi:hypothetical protein